MNLGIVPERPRTPQRLGEVCNHLRQGLSNKEIAARMGITPRTVKWYISFVMRKAGLWSKGDERRMIIYVLTGPRI